MRATAKSREAQSYSHGLRLECGDAAVLPSYEVREKVPERENLKRERRIKCGAPLHVDDTKAVQILHA